MKSFTAIAVFGLAALVAAGDVNTVTVTADVPDVTTTAVDDVPAPTTTAVDNVPAPTTTAVDDVPAPTTTADAEPVNNTATGTGTGTSTGGAAPTGGLPPKVQPCKSAYEQCQGSYTDAATCNSQFATCQAACKTTQTQCVAAGNGGATCASEAAVCLGYDPYTNPSGLPSGSGADSGPVTVTMTVPSVVTYCPGATQFSTNGQTYTATGPGYVTITNCPCTITSVVGSTPTSPAGNYGKGNTTYTGPKYTGAANKVIGASLSVVAAGAAFFAFAL